MLLWFTDSMNVTEEVTRLNVSTLLSSAFIRSDLNGVTRGPFIRSLKLMQTKVLRYFWERKEIFASPSIDHSFLLALKYISRVVSFVSTRQV